MAFFKREKKISDMLIAYQNTFNSEDGQRVLYDLMKTLFIFKSTMDPNPHELAYNEGQRSVILRILSTLGTDPEHIIKLMELGKSEETNYAD